MQDLLTGNKAKDGPPRWINVVEKRFEKLGMTIHDRPYTAQEGVQLRGLRRQATQPNFLHTLVDCRWEKSAQVQGFDSKLALPPGFEVLTDCRQAPPRQKANGRCTMLTRSVLFNHRLQRVHHHLEHFRIQGWDDVDLEELTTTPLPDMWEDLNERH